MSITHHEYRRAKQKGMPILIYIKGHAEIQRAPETQNLMKEIQDDGYKYKRFGNYLELQREVRASLVKLHKEKYAIEPSSDENKIAEQTFEAASDFETQSLKRIRIEEMELGIARQLIANAEQKNPQDLGKSEIVHHLLLRGLIWTEINTGAHYGTAAGIMLFAHDPSAVFPQCRFLADAYRGQEPDGDPSDHVDIRGPIATSIEKIITFIEKNTRHPIRVVGLNRVRLDEYPVEALREALVNAAAHRVYEDAGRKTMVEVFSDRIVISIPGLPPTPLTLQKLRSGKYKPCSRNPILAQCLSYFHRIEERGSGFRRMREQMINHGLNKPRLATDTGYFQVIFPGPAENIDRLRVPASVIGRIITPSMEEQLSERQKKMVSFLTSGEELTSRKCSLLFDITRDTANRDFKKLVELGIAKKVGAGRSTCYVLQTKK